MGHAQKMQAARDKHPHRPRSYPEDNLCRDPIDNAREWHMCGTGPPECRERQTRAGAFGTQVQARLTLEFPHTASRLFMLVCMRAVNLSGSRGAQALRAVIRSGTVRLTIKVPIPPRGLNDVNLVKRKRP
jgi:hypothetical protein